MVPIFFQKKKKCTQLTLYSHIRLVKAAKARYFQECPHAFLKGTYICRAVNVEGATRSTSMLVYMLQVKIEFRLSFFNLG